MESDIYKNLEDVGKDFVDILKKNNSQCSHKDTIIGSSKLRYISCSLENGRLTIIYYRDTGEILDLIHLKKLSKSENVLA